MGECLSYAALARRLSMNASTLHRYCAGEAVPLDFTGIERFAALCGASPEERVELDRRWILAVAARQRPRSSDARRTPTPHVTTSTESPTCDWYLDLDLVSRWEAVPIEVRHFDLMKSRAKPEAVVQ